MKRLWRSRKVVVNAKPQYSYPSSIYHGEQFESSPSNADRATRDLRARLRASSPRERLGDTLNGNMNPLSSAAPLPAGHVPKRQSTSTRKSPNITARPDNLAVVPVPNLIVPKERTERRKMQNQLAQKAYRARTKANRVAVSVGTASPLHAFPVGHKLTTRRKSNTTTTTSV